MVIALGVGFGCFCYQRYRRKKNAKYSVKLARNRGKTIRTPVYDAVSVYTGDCDEVLKEEFPPTQLAVDELDEPMQTSICVTKPQLSDSHALTSSFPVLTLASTSSSLEQQS